MKNPYGDRALLLVSDISVLGHVRIDNCNTMLAVVRSVKIRSQYSENEKEHNYYQISTRTHSKPDTDTGQPLCFFRSGQACMRKSKDKYQIWCSKRQNPSPFFMQDLFKFFYSRAKIFEQPCATSISFLSAQRWRLLFLPQPGTTCAASLEVRSRCVGRCPQVLLTWHVQLRPRVSAGPLPEHKHECTNHLLKAQGHHNMKEGAVISRLQAVMASQSSSWWYWSRSWPGFMGARRRRASARRRRAPTGSDQSNEDCSNRRLPYRLNHESHMKKNAWGVT